MSDDTTVHMSDGSVMACLRCNGPMQSRGQLEIVTGGSSAASKMFFGQWAEMNEKNWSVSVVRCANCGRVEMYERG